MRPILILQHQTPERPAYLAAWLNVNQIPHETRNAGTGEEFPTSIEPYSAMAIMGGGMSANDALLSNRQAEILILQAVLKNRPVIGHCLGGQLMSRALGAKITASPQPEIGWQPIEYAKNSLVEHWFGTDPTPVVMQWHYETFSLPDGATRLATNGCCLNQAWTLGPHLAMQFHIEMDTEKAQAWAQDEDPNWAQARAEYSSSVQDSQKIIEGIDLYLSKHQATADRIYQTWLNGVPADL